MKWYNIINFILCIIILHLLIRNLDIKYSFNENLKPKEEFNNIDPSDNLYNFINSPNASNIYSSNNGPSNFESNIIDTNSYYKENNIEEFVYKNELPMNGGVMDGVVGNSSLDDKYSSIKDLLNPIEEQSMSNVDDLRNGLNPPLFE